MAVTVALLADAEAVRAVGPQVFWPQPKVQSMLLRLRPRDPALARELKERGMPALLQRGFAQRRKTLRKRFDPARLAAAGIDPGARPQEVDPAAWRRLLTVPPP